MSTSNPCSEPRRKRAAIVTLGCRLNQADTALLADRLQRAGWSICEAETAEAGSLDAVIVNSCTVTASAARKSRSAARRFRREHPQARIVITGCGAEVDPGGNWEGDLVTGNAGKRDVAAWLESGTLPVENEQNDTIFYERAAGNFPFRSRAFIKIQEGCNNFCSYCIVPYARGRERSRAWEEVIADCRHAVEAGYPEIVLTGVNVCAYSDHGRALGDVIDAVCAWEGDYRVRLSSTEPHPSNRSLIDAMARNSHRVCRFLHLSLQHGCDRILHEMNRKYTTREYAGFVAAARAALPGIHIGSDLIVGFPGESDDDFARSCDFVREMAFANLHIFPYSPRRGTPAAKRKDQIPGDVVEHRRLQLQQIAEQSARDFRLSQTGLVLPVVFEEQLADGTLTGWSDNYLRVTASGPAVELDRICHVRYQE